MEWLKLMLCSAVSGSQWFSLSILLWTLRSWSWHSTQRAPSLPSFTSRLAPSAPASLLQNKTDISGQGRLGCKVCWQLPWLQCWNGNFSVAGRLYHQLKGSATQHGLTCSTYRRPAVMTAAWIFSMRSLRSSRLLLLWLANTSANTCWIYILH